MKRVKKEQGKGKAVKGEPMVEKKHPIWSLGKSTLNEESLKNQNTFEKLKFPYQVVLSGCERDWR